MYIKIEHKYVSIYHRQKFQQWVKAMFLFPYDTQLSIYLLYT